jgi:4-aminobutyrate aminotransferase / (S)-3-amino-2-methylpropionate transaminase / 5-aminovalerate transaminase
MAGCYLAGVAARMQFYCTRLAKATSEFHPHSAEACPHTPVKEARLDTVEKYKQYVITSCTKGVEPVVIAHGRGATVVDVEGKSYLDCYAGISVVNAGHCNEQVNAAARAQMERLIHANVYSYYLIPAGDLAERLAQILPDPLQKTFFCNSGAEAIEGALRIMKKYTKARETISLNGSFHGRTYGTLSITGQAGRKRGGGPYAGGSTFAPAPYCYRCSYRMSYPDCGLACAEAIEDVFRFQTSDDVAAFIAEPVMGEGGILTPPDEYFRVAVGIVRDHGALWLADEVQTGFGRTGKMFAFEHYGVVPDAVAMAKGIANGYPLGAFTTRAEIADSFEPGDHLSTFGGNPVSCAASLANIAFLEAEDLPGQSARKGAVAMERFQALKEKHPIIGDVRGRGLMIGIELIEDGDKTPAAAATGKVKAYCRENGLLLGSGGVFGNVLRFQPPLVISDEEIDRAVNTIDAALTAV